MLTIALRRLLFVVDASHSWRSRRYGEERRGKGRVWAALILVVDSGADVVAVGTLIHAVHQKSR